MAPVSASGTVLVTGANGFIASHVIDQLLGRGYYVRGTVRSHEKGVLATSIFNKCHEQAKFSYVVVSDMSTPGAFDIAAEGCSGIAHVASILTLSDDPHKTIDPVLSGLKELLQSAMKSKTVKRFVLTSSMIASGPAASDDQMVFDETTIDRKVVDRAWNNTSGPNKPLEYYAASKVQSETLAKAFLASNNYPFELNIVRPAYTIGRIFDDSRTSTARRIRHLFQNPSDEQNRRFVEILTGYQWHINVQDVAMLHVAALIFEDVCFELLYAADSPINMNSWWAAFAFIDKTRLWPDKDHGLALPNVEIQNKRSRELLKRMGRTEFKSVVESVRESLV